MPVTKLESLDARKSAAIAISSGRPIVPRGDHRDEIFLASFGAVVEDTGVGARWPARAAG
jgi:hypothetical protein